MISNAENAEKSVYECRVFTRVQSLLSVHQRVGTDDVDEAAGASFHFVHQEGQIVELVLNKQKQSKAKMLINKFCYPYNGSDHMSTGTWRSRIRVPCRCSRAVASE